MVPETGLEPVSLKAGDFKSPVYTNSTTLAQEGFAGSNRPSFESALVSLSSSAVCNQQFPRAQGGI